MRINPWLLWALVVLALAFAWGLFAMLDEALKGLRWRLYQRRYWRQHCRTDCRHCARRREAQHNA